MVKINPLSWLSATMRGPLSDDSVPGTVWQYSTQNDSTVAPTDSTIRSLSSTGGSRRVCFRNCSDQTVLLCWVDDKGQPHHFHPLEPYRHPAQPNFLRGGMIGRDVIVTADDHVESTWEGHAFLLACADDIHVVRQAKSLSQARIIGGYRPEAGKGKNCSNDSETTVELVEIYNTTNSGGFKNIHDLLSCCRPSKRQLQSNDDTPDTVKEATPSLHHHAVSSKLGIRIRLGIVDPTPLDTTQKPYERQTIGECAWPVRVESGSLTPDIAQALAEDLDEMSKCLPPHAVQALRENTPIWINASLRYGPRACPITARGMCYHPGSGWLDDMGMCVDKCESVELYKASEYLTDRPLWGKGGLLIHEFSHAYHHKCCKDGYNNEIIKKCYEQAMKDKLYESVSVHGRQGPKARAYACSDPMEYFAELSTAFLGGAPKRLHARGDSVDFEFNKWYPFNRQQIQEHDPRAFEMLKTIWNIE